MEQNFTLISTLAAGFVFALVFGVIAQRFRVPPLVGYLLAGIIISPATPGYVADVELAHQLSEIGIMLLMFGVGLHFSLKDLLRVKAIAIPGAVAQMALATLLGMVVSHLWGWSWGQCFVFGLSLSCASTVVLLKALDSKGILKTMDGQIAVGWLVVEDIMTVVLLVLLPPLAAVLGGSIGTSTAMTAEGSQPLWLIFLSTLGRVAAFIAFMLVFGKRVLPWLLWQVAKTGSRELFTLCVLASAIGIAYGASLVFDVSFALGAFFAGMVMQESKYAHAAAIESLPLQDAFSVIFFVGVGMMFEPSILVSQPLQLLLTLAIIMLGKSAGAFFLVLLFRRPLHTALTVAAALAQIGEFSFILAGLGVSLGLLPREGMSLILAAAILSIALNPVAFALVPSIKEGMKKRWSFALAADRRAARDFRQEHVKDEEKRKVIIVGGAAAGAEVARALKAEGVPFTIVEDDPALIRELEREGLSVTPGPAESLGTLAQAGVQDASLLLVAMPNSIRAIRAVGAARELNPDLKSAVFAKNAAEAERFRENIGISEAFYAEKELARAAARFALEQAGRANPEGAAAPGGKLALS
ncbi:cation:proton antiporter [Mesosutterella sp. OilRF-GAM-744-9]|uniref:Cation:proton antiporter n=1 Tax=Mesosutterella porci TaxID=2915351 RepID=A0ABS9MQ51_9BURK|nr:cation:proton antiporter [Mesosutterella sp. oilRF-744-WT-GAM-9]MCG5030725.1 cation:proton antiporter [Mesosutterella sp. oilRF-744-WT-GAM-9]